MGGKSFAVCQARVGQRAVWEYHVLADGKLTKRVTCPAKVIQYWTLMRGVVLDSLHRRSYMELFYQCAVQEQY